VNHTSVPRIATWLLKRFGCSPKNDSLVGDLIEHRQSGRSRFWYWKQVLVAIAAGLVGEIREHKLLTVRAIAIGWSVPILYHFVFHPFIVEMLWRLEPWIVVQHPSFYHSYYHDLERFVWGESGSLLQFLALQCLLGFLNGWLVARLNRGNPRMPVMAYAASVSICAMMNWTYYLLVTGQMPPLFPPILFVFVVADQLSVVVILAGGGLLRDSKRKDAFRATTT